MADLKSAQNFKPFWCLERPNRMKIDQVVLKWVTVGLNDHDDRAQYAFRCRRSLKTCAHTTRESAQTKKFLKKEEEEEKEETRTLL